jgi:hypothetical protein
MSYEKRSEVAAPASVLLFLPRFFCTGVAVADILQLLVDGASRLKQVRFFLCGGWPETTRQVIAQGKLLMLPDRLTRMLRMLWCCTAIGSLAHW